MNQIIDMSWTNDCKLYGICNRVMTGELCRAKIGQIRYNEETGGLKFVQAWNMIFIGKSAIDEVHKKMNEIEQTKGKRRYRIDGSRLIKKEEDY